MPDEHGRIDEDSIKAATGQFDLESVFKLTMSHMGITTIENLSMCPNLTVCASRCWASRLPHPLAPCPFLLAGARFVQQQHQSHHRSL